MVPGWFPKKRGNHPSTMSTEVGTLQSGHLHHLMPFIQLTGSSSILQEGSPVIYHATIDSKLSLAANMSSLGDCLENELWQIKTAHCFPGKTGPCSRLFSSQYAHFFWESDSHLCLHNTSKHYQLHRQDALAPWSQNEAAMSSHPWKYP